MVIGNGSFMEILRMMYFESEEHSRQCPSDGIVVWRGQDLGETIIRSVKLKQRVNKRESWTWTKIGENPDCWPEDLSIFNLESDENRGDGALWNRNHL